MLNWHFAIYNKLDISMRPWSTLLVTFLFVGNAWGGPYPGDKKSFYGDEMMKNACSTHEQKRIRNEVMAFAKERSPNEAWRLTQEMLCGLSAKSENFVKSKTATTINYQDNTETPDGTNVTSMVDGSKIALLKGLAWNAHVVSDNDVIRVLYDHGGVCTGGFDMSYKKGSWEIVANGIYCD